MAIPTPISLFLISSLLTLGLLAPPSTSTTDYVIYSDPPTALLPGQNFSYDLTPRNLPYGPVDTYMQTDCNLVVYYKNVLQWASNTSGMGDNCYLTVDSYGEAFVLRNYVFPVWRSNVRSVKGNYALMMHNVGGLMTIGPSIWSTDNEPLLSSPELSDESTDYVYYSYTVSPIGSLIADYKNFKVDLTPDCNLMVRDTNTGKIMWETNTYSPYRDCFLTLDASGELFIKHRRREILWRTGKSSTSLIYVMILRHDGRLVIYGPQVWTTKPLW